jgi:ComF family protein
MHMAAGPVHAQGSIRRAQPSCQLTMKIQVHNWPLAVQQLLLPARCILCGDRAYGRTLDLCHACEMELPLNTTACQLCAQPLQSDLPSNVPCGACVKRRPRFDAAHCVFRFAYPIDHMVRALKYRDAPQYGRVMGALLAASCVQRMSIARPTMIVPVPLSERRFRERGYNQSMEIARWLHRPLGVPVRRDVLKRARHTDEQTRLSAKERRRNVRNAFAVMCPVRNERIVVLDDVITTASTVNEIARSLRKAGAAYIEVWAAARAVVS